MFRRLKADWLLLVSRLGYGTSFASVAGSGHNRSSNTFALDKVFPPSYTGDSLASKPH